MGICVLERTAPEATFGFAVVFFEGGLAGGGSEPVLVNTLSTADLVAHYTFESYDLRVLDIREDDIVFSPPKIFFAYGFGNSCTFPFSVGAAAGLLSGDAFREWQRRTGLAIVEGLGSTEVPRIYVSNRLDRQVSGASGARVPGYELNSPTSTVRSWRSKAAPPSTLLSAHAPFTRTLQTFVKQRLVPCKYSRVIDYSTVLPKAGVVKIDRQALKRGG